MIDFKMLNEAKQSIVNLGIPPLIASIFEEKFGKNAYLIAKWFKESKTMGEPRPNWWQEAFINFDKPKIQDMVALYEVALMYKNGKLSLEDYDKKRDHLGFAKTRPEDDIDRTLAFLKSQIKEDFLKSVFFVSNFIKAIQSGEIKDLKPYAKLNWHQAEEKYETKKVFSDRQPTKAYSNGWKWIDVGAKCSIVGTQMRNCGSSGVMSSDPKRTIMTLFNPSNVPHVVATYSPSENRISGVEGQASTQVKPEYMDYVLDLVKTLGAEFDVEKSKSKLLNLKYVLSPTHIERLDKPTEYEYNEYYFLTLSSGKSYFTNGYALVSKEDMDKIHTPQNTPLSKCEFVFNYRNKDEVLDQNPKLEMIQLNRFTQLVQEQNLKLFIGKVIKEALRS